MWKSLIIILLITFLNIAGQNSRVNKINNVYLEGLGNSGLASLNYELAMENKYFLRFGIGTSPGSSSSGFHIDRITPLFIFGLHYNINFGSTSNLEIGVDATIPTKLSGGLVHKAFLSGLVGYRLQPTNGGFVLRITCYIMTTDDYPPLFPGISLGYNF